MNDTHLIIAELHRQHADDLFSAGARLALELECLLLETRDTAAVSKWWDSALEALEMWRLALEALELRCGTNAEERNELIPALRERLSKGA